MGIESYSAQFPCPMNGFHFEEETLFLFSHGNFSNTLNYSGDTFPFATLESSHAPAASGVIAEGDLASSDSDSDDTVLKFINQVLMDENMDQMPCMFHDPLALQATEKSFYDALFVNRAPSMNHSHSPACTDSSDDNCSGISSDYGINSNSSILSGSASFDYQWISDTGDCRPSIFQTPILENFVFQSSAKSKSGSSLDSERPLIGSNGTVGSSESELLVPNIFTDEESLSYFLKGMEEASKFLPKGNPLTMDLRKDALNLIPRAASSMPGVNLEKNGPLQLSSLPCGLRMKKHERDDTGSEEGRSSKQSAISLEDETELSEMFDRVLLCARTHQNSNTDKTSQNELIQTAGFTDERPFSNTTISKKGTVDLRALLLACAQAVSDDDPKTADHFLQQIRKHCSPFGDGSQRLAHCFANALEARMAGTGTQIYAALSSKRTSATETLKAYQTYLSVFPFQRFGIIFSNHMILMNLAEKASTLHIIDFGILYGFQWPALIQCLSRRAGGPPKLRITGIELPQRGFRPAERVKETGHRIAMYCKRFNVPFEYNAIAQKWETIRIADLAVRPGETVAVNCLFRFRHLYDETVVLNSPRSHVLNLVSRIRPSLFTHSVVNGNYNASFFVTRFREALFHYSAMFDAFDSELPREDPMRLTFEKNFFGREAINIIACEGMERVERTETYKQWQIRNTRAGLKQLPLDPVIIKKLKLKLKEGYHEDFVLDVDGGWMLQGWKGRILYASSCWVPA
ncbi:hypothetical protein SAY87_017886 [Trapa incisa]|uniref:Scarecrow-like protein 14 n=1 Tax=Trapa incisa TaxID=236973 RepID=A0AAN7L4J3_9MYRT|nr:hypothetical protein SAY87_017886 [Trapa incisa]